MEHFATYMLGMFVGCGMTLWTGLRGWSVQWKKGFDDGYELGKRHGFETGVLHVNKQLVADRIGAFQEMFERSTGLKTEERKDN